MRIACATNDGKHFTEKHFGDADKYLIYESKNNKFNLIDTIRNTTDEEKKHADPGKAKSIVSLLLEKNVDVGLTKVFGPNIKRVKKHFVPVMVSVDLIEDGLKEVQTAIVEVKHLIDLGENREHLDLRKR